MADQDGRTEAVGPGSTSQTIGDRYETVARLGAGTFGEVLRAHDRLLRRDVALKRVRLEAFAGPGQLEEARERFRREAQAAARLRHPNIVTTHDIIDGPSASYIVMELVEGRDLQSVLLEQGTLGLAETASILEQVASALDHAHALGVVHRDVKPANVMIEPTGRVKVMDFGIAKLEAGGNLTATGLILGTPNYMAPEQARGEKVDGRADLFSLGCILYECLSGRKPFQADSVATILVKILTEEPPPLELAGRGLPTALEEVVRRAMARDPERRYRWGADLVAALREAGGIAAGAGVERVARLAATDAAEADLVLDSLDDEGPQTVVSPGPPSGAPPPDAGARRPGARPALLAAALAVLAAAAVLLATGSLSPGPAPPPPADGALVQEEPVSLLGRLLGRRPRLLINVPAATPLRLALSSPLSSESATVGDSFAAVVAEPVVVEGREAIPAGTRAVGRVTHAQPSARAAGRAELTLVLDRLVLEDGQTLRVQASPLLFRSRPPTRKETGVAGALASVGSLVGGWLGGKKPPASSSAAGGGDAAGTVLTTRGDEVTLSPGASLPFALAAPVRVTRPIPEP